MPLPVPVEPFGVEKEEGNILEEKRDEASRVGWMLVEEKNRFPEYSSF